MPTCASIVATGGEASRTAGASAWSAGKGASTLGAGASNCARQPGCRHTSVKDLTTQSPHHGPRAVEGNVTYKIQGVQLQEQKLPSESSCCAPQEAGLVRRVWVLCTPEWLERPICLSWTPAR